MLMISSKCLVNKKNVKTTLNIFGFSCFYFIFFFHFSLFNGGV